MSDYKQKPETGSLFRNKEQPTDKHPLYSGSALINGVEYYLDAWVNEGPKGKYMSIKFKPKTQQPSQQEASSDEGFF